MKHIINDWVPEVSSLLKRLLDAGFKLVAGDNGECEFQYQSGRHQQFIEELIACDESRLYVECLSDGKQHWLFLVLGNEPGVLVNDYSCHPDLDDVVDQHYVDWTGQEQPKKEIEI